MYLRKRLLFLLFFISIFSICNTVAGQEINDEYLLKTHDIAELVNEYPILIGDSLDSHSIYKIKGLDLNDEVLKQLEQDPRVISFSHNHSIHMPIREPQFSLFQALIADNYWGFQSMNFPQHVFSRKTVDVAILDTGIDSDHPLLTTSIKKGFDALQNKSVEDTNGHGTHVAGIIAMNTPQVQIIPIKTLNRFGKGDLYAFVRGIYYAIEQDAEVINLSFGINSDNEMVKEAVEKAIAEGIAIVAATGNNGSPFIQYPARYNDVIAVGAYNQDEVWASFSQYGEELDFVAPGADIWSSWLHGEYKVQSGTSMAAPFITKTVALLKSIDESLSPADIDKLLAASSSPLTGDIIERIGHGKVNVERALELVDRDDMEGDYKFFHSKFAVPAAKEWKIQMSLPLNTEKFDSNLIRVMNQQGDTIETDIVLDETDRTIIHVFPPANGYDPGGSYELFVEKGLVSESGKTALNGVRMRFSVEE